MVLSFSRYFVSNNMNISSAMRTITVLLAIFSIVGFISAKEFVFKTVDSCTEGNQAARCYFDSSATKIRGLTFDTDVICNVSSSHSSAAVIRIKRCTSERKGCMQLQSLRFSNDVCSMINDKHAMWTPFFSAASPSVTCPIKDTTYRFRNATIDQELVFRMLPFFNTGNFWELKFLAYEDKSLIICSVLSMASKSQ